MEEAIRADLESSFGLHGDSVNPVSGGLDEPKMEACLRREGMAGQAVQQETFFTEAA